MAIELKHDTPPEVISTLEYLLAPLDIERPYIKSNHPLFSTQHFASILTGSSYYIAGTSNSIMEYDESSKRQYLTVRSQFKNYDNEVMQFLHWIAPFSQTGNYSPPGKGRPPRGPGRHFVGYFCTDGEDDNPTLIFMKEGKAYLGSVGILELRALQT